MKINQFSLSGNVLKFTQGNANADFQKCSGVTSALGEGSVLPRSENFSKYALHWSTGRTIEMISAAPSDELEIFCYFQTTDYRVTCSLATRTFGFYH